MMNILTILNHYVWDQVLIYLLVGAGVYFSIRLNFIQFRTLFHALTVLKHDTARDEKGISFSQSLWTGLAARVGTGNMAGVAVALSLGGPGSVFWMWLIALLGMASAFVETCLCQLYKVQDDQGRFRGGPAYYIEKGIGSRKMGILFSCLLITAFGFMFNAVQANSIADALIFAFDIPLVPICIGLVIVVSVVIFGGLKKIARTAELVVPAMALCYLLLAAFVVAMNIEKVPTIVSMIFKSAFGFQEAAAGGMGYAVSQAMINGIKRGLFSNEAGMGSAPNIAASAAPCAHPAAQGYVQMLGVFIDTIVICTATVAIILLSGEYTPHLKVEGIALTQQALNSQFGDIGGIFIAVAVFFFAFTSIIANYSYAESCWIFIFRKRQSSIVILRCCVLAMLVFGASAKLEIVWSLADASMGLMAIVNLVAILWLSNKALLLAVDYQAQLKAGKVPRFNVLDHPSLQAEVEPGVWELSADGDNAAGVDISQPEAL